MKRNLLLALCSLLPLALVGSGCSVLKLHRGQVLGALKGAGVQPHQIDLPVGKMQYLSGGDGYPIVFVHGFGASAPDTWKDQLIQFSSKYRVLAPDLFWFGNSVPAAGQKFSTPDEQAKAIVALMDRHSLKKAHVVGVSFGGYIAQKIAILFPERVSRLVLVDAAGLAPTKAEMAQVQKTFAYAKGELPRLLMPDDAAQLKKFLDLISYKPRYIPGFAMQEILEQMFWKNKAAKTRIANHLIKTFIPKEQHQGIKAKTLVVWGRHDRLLLPSMGKRLAASIPGAKIVILEKSGHIPMLEQPKAFNKTLAAFLP